MVVRHELSHVAQDWKSQGEEGGAKQKGRGGTGREAPGGRDGTGRDGKRTGQEGAATKERDGKRTEGKEEDRE